MIPLYTHAAAALLAGALAFAGAWKIQAWRMGEQLSSLKAGHAQTLQAIADKTAKASEAVRKYENGVAELLADKDAKYYKELTHAQSETARMRACVAAGTCGVRIVTVAARDSGRDRPQDAAPGCVGDAAGALDAGVAERVLDLRDAIAADAAALGYLQEYARQCAGAAHAE